MAFTPRTTKPSKTSKYYSAPGNPFEPAWTMWVQGNCTSYAWGRFHEIMGTLSDATNCHLNTGNAEDWYGGTTGYKKGSTPKLGAVLCFRDGPYSGNGHVAIVEKISSDSKTIWTSESGYKAWEFRYRERKAPNWNTEGYVFQGFIYNPATITSASTVEIAQSSTQQTALIDKYGNEARTYFYLREVGWTHKGTCAVMGNIKQESNFNPGVEEATTRKDKGYGICQWTFGRRTALEKWLKGHSYASNSLKGQCEYLDYETKSNGAYKALYAALTKETSLSVGELARKFCKEWERPNEAYAHYEVRISSAETYYKRYAGNWESIGLIDEEGTVSGVDFNKTTELLVSSNNFEYLSKTQKKEPTKAETFIQNYKKTLEESNSNLVPLQTSNTSYKQPLSILQTIDNLVNKANVKQQKSPGKSTFGEAVTGSSLPIYNTVVEAPFGEVEILGTKFGTRNVYNEYDSYPNYVQSIEITKTNGTINEYTINLVHQITAGNNPNYIASLLSNIGYNEITISYGDANYGEYYHDIKAMVIGVNTSFDFQGYNIKYTIKATSLAYLTATTKLNFPATTDKPSNVILGLIKDNSLSLTDYFPGMANISYVLSRGLIPTNDKKIDIESVTNTTIVSYLSYLTALMQNENEELSDKSTYYLSINDEEEQGTFSIKEVISGNIQTDSLVYEVDVGYPDANMVFDFNVTTNYAWSAAYAVANKITNYSYDINDNGQLQSKKTLNLISSTVTDNQYMIDDNTWKQLTRFPLTATLTVKELLSPIMLLTYIKVNNYYFGSKRITSGVYIVTEQKDSISGNGCRTTLGLTRVASDIESITLDGRVRT